MSKRYLAFLLAIVIIVTGLVACSKTAVPSDTEIVTEAPTQIAEDATSFKLSYSQTDSLNPYESITLNNQIVQDLVYDSLFVLDERYEAQPQIASEYKYLDNKMLIVSVKSNVVFSDGTPVTADDVVASFYEAQISKRWKNSLKPFSEAYSGDGNTVTFELNEANPNAHNLLTFAITKARDDDENGYLIGSGRYTFSNEKTGLFLVANKEDKDFKPHFTKIRLVNITSSESIDNALNIGNITFAFRDLADGDNTRMTCNKKMVTLNNLVYIGINSNIGICSNASIRNAISLAIDRETLVKSAYQGNASIANSVFNPMSKYAKNTTLFSSNSDTPAAKQAIAQSGYGEDELKIDILVNKNKNRVAMAKLIKQQLEEVGFTVTINSTKNKEYKSNIKNGYFDIYIGETKIPDDMRLNSFFTKKGETHYGITLKNSKTIDAYNEFIENDGEIGAFLLSFSEEMPFVPILYRQGMICYSRSLHGDMQGYYNNYFSNIQDWYCS